MPKTKIAITKEYKITVRALPAQHNLFYEFVKRFFFTEHIEKYGKTEIEVKVV